MKWSQSFLWNTVLAAMQFVTLTDQCPSSPLKQTAGDAWWCVDWVTWWCADWVTWWCVDWVTCRQFCFSPSDAMNKSRFKKSTWKLTFLPKSHILNLILHLSFHQWIVPVPPPPPTNHPSWQIDLSFLGYINIYIIQGGASSIDSAFTVPETSLTFVRTGSPRWPCREHFSKCSQLPRASRRPTTARWPTRSGHHDPADRCPPLHL